MSLSENIEQPGPCPTCGSNGEGEIMESLARLTRDLRDAAKRFGPDQARFFVDSYYLIQRLRIRFNNQIKALSGAEEPTSFLHFVAEQARILEDQVSRALDAYSGAHPVGQWMRAQHGVGKVIAAGFLAHIDIRQAPTVGHIWAFAGLDPTRTWKKGQKRPHNAGLKTLCWKLGESFTKTAGGEDSYYGPIYQKRKALEIKRNEAGQFADQAEAKLRDFKIDKQTDAYKWYAGCFTADAAFKIRAAEPSLRPALVQKLAGEPGSGVPMLPPARIQLRAQRYAVKLFLAHLHEVWYRHEFNEAPPKPYVITHLGHAHQISPPTPTARSRLIERGVEIRKAAARRERKGRHRQ